MLRRFGLFVAAVLFASSALGQVVINEIDYDQVGTDGAEFVELKNVSGGVVNLDLYTVQLVNGNAGGAAVYDTIDLPNVNLAAGGYYVICANGANVPNCNLVDTPLTDWIQNGAPDAVGLRLSGVLIDAVSYEGNSGAPYTETTGVAVASADSNTVAFIGLSRFPDGTDTGNNSADLSLRCITPGLTNVVTAAGCTAPPFPPNLTVTDVTQVETNAGTTIFSFTVNLSSPAGASGVTFDIATADGTAQDDNPATEDNDYVGQSLTSQTITSGNSSFPFSVTVNGDVAVESDETFFVNVSNVTGAVPTDPQGLGTIQNDDAACATLSINDVTQAETDAGTPTFAFTVSLSQAGCGTVTFDIATQDNTATTADNDYVAQSLTGQTITFPAIYTFNVTVNGDATAEPDQTFFVNLTNVSPASVQVGDPQGLGTIVNDDFTRIHDIQGPGATSPLSGVVTTRGIVTGRKSNGYFIQEPDPSIDADPLTSEGIFVFTSAAPPAAAAIGNLVEVTGTIAEFSPSSDPLQPPLTEITTATTVQLSTGNPLPAAIPLTATFPDPAGPYDQLERVEGMRVSVASLTVGGPTLGNVSEANATATSTGVFYGTVTGVPRAFREPGIQDPDPAPSGGGTIPPIPRFDSNPEVIRVDADGIGGTLLDVGTGAVVTGLIGPLDYGFRKYTILPEAAPTPAPVVVGGPTATAAAIATGREFTVAAYNLERFFDTVNDPGIGEPVLTATAFNNRLNKASLGIRNFLQTPDVIGIVEIENLTTLQALAAKVNNDAVAASQPDPQYVAYLTEGNDVGGIDVGFLVKTSIVTGSTPRITVNAVVQENAAELFVNPDTSTSLLNDRPSLRLDAVVNDPNGATFPVTVIVNHLRSLNGANDEAAGSNGWATDGQRVRAKRQKQAESLANLVQTRQTNNPAERIILVGDFNAFEFNDGLGDSMNVITGTPPPDNQTAVPGDGVDLVNPDLDNLFDTSTAPERYSFVFDGNAQSLDHVVVNSALISSTVARRLEHPRINADFAAIDRNNSATALRLADHDPVVGFFEVAAFAVADVSLTKTDSPDPVNAGTNLIYTITVTNAGPDPAATAAWSDALPAGTTFVSLPAVAGWSCTTPAVGANGTVSCSNPSFAVGSTVFTLTVNVAPTVAASTVLSNTATATSTTADPNTGNESDTETTTVATSADLQLSKTDSPDPVNAGSNLTYQITLTNNGPSNAASASFSDPLPAGTTFVSLSTTGSWTCTTPAVGATGTVSCSNTSFGVTVDFFTIVVNVDPTLAPSTVLSNTATLSSSTPDPNTGNESGTATTTVTTSADLSVTKTDSPDPVTAGTNLTYTITVNNAGPSNASTVALSDTLPAGTTFVSLSSPGGWSCTTPAVGATGAISCSIATLAAGNAVFTLTVNVNPGVVTGTVITNTATATSTTSDPNTGNESGTATTTVGTGSADLSVTKADSPDPVTAGTNLTYTITVNNAGPANATTVSMSDTTPSGTTFASLTSPGGWSCTTPAVGSTGAINCSIASLGVTSAVFTLVVNVNSATVAVSNTATVTSATADPNTGNESDTETTAVATSSDLQLTKSDSPDPVTAGTNLTYTIGISNVGPSDASGVTVTDIVPANTTFVSLSSLADFSCTTPAVGGTGTITCTKPTPLVANSSGNFTLVVNVNPATPDGTVITNTATVTATTTDPNTGNESATATTTVGVGSADLSVTKTDSPDPVNAGGTLTYTITVNNAGPTNASTVSLSDTLPVNTTFVSLASAAGWSCTTPAVGAAGTVSCTNASVVVGNSVFTLTVAVDAATAANTLLSNTATVTSATTDPASGNNSATETTAVRSPATLSATKTASGTFQPSSTVTYTIVISNSGPSAQGNNPGDEMVDVLPPQLILATATATSGTAVANTGTNTVTWNGSIAAGSSVTVTITATIANFASPGTTITNQATISYDADGNGTNEATAQSDNPATGAADATGFVVAPSSHIGNIPTLDARTLLALAALLATVAIMAMKKA